MVLRFLCPNGHKIHCPDDRAGKSARCPKCGVKFQVPAISDLEMSGSGDSLPAVADSGAFPVLGDSGVFPVVSVAERPAPVQEQLEFLCPNGHRLYGPVSLQGRPGQCPECGSKFHIPAYLDVPDEEQPDPPRQIDLLGVEADEGSGATLARAEDQPEARAGGEEPASAAADGSRPEDRRPAPHPLAALFSRLWAERSQGVAIELHLVDGETITPDQFAVKPSQGSHGLFGVQEPDGTVTLAAVAWESICRVLVRGLKQLPEELQDEGPADRPPPTDPSTDHPP